MRNPVHIIKAQEYQIVYDDASAAHRLQTAISGLQDTRIDPLLDQILDRFSSDDYVYQFDTIELDLGSVTASNYENELIYRIEETLTAYLSATIYEKGKLRSGISIATEFGLLEHLEYYLDKGHFKWNSNLNKPTSVLLEELLKTKPHELRMMLKRSGKMSRTRKRMIFQFSDAELDEIVRLVAGKDGEYIIDYKDNVLEYQKQNSVIESPHSSVKTVVWEIVFGYLFAENKSYYDKRSFLQYLIEKMASNYSLDYGQLLNTLTNAVENNSHLANRKGEFSKLITDLTAMSLPQLEMVKTKDNEEQVSSWFDEFSYYLENGTFRQDASSSSKSQFNEELLKRLQSGDKILRKKLDSWLLDPAKLHRLMAITVSGSLNEIVDRSEIPSILVAREFLGKLKGDRSLSDPSNRFYKKVFEARGELIVKLPVARNYSEKKQLTELLRNMLSISLRNEDSIIQFLMVVKPGLSERYQNIVSGFLMTFYQNMGKVVLEGITDEIKTFTLNNSEDFWYEWLKEKMTGWSQATKLTPAKILSYVERNLRSSQTSAIVKGFVKKVMEFPNSAHVPLQALAEAQEKRDAFESDPKLLRERQNEILYLFEHGKLPWWIEASTFWNNFNEEYERLWRSPEHRKKIVRFLKQNEQTCWVVSFLEEDQYYSLLMELAGSQGKEKVLFLNSIRHFIYHNLIPLGIISTIEYRSFKENMLSILASKDKNSWSELLRFAKSWKGNVAINSKQSLTNAFGSMLDDLLNSLKEPAARKDLKEWRNELPNFLSKENTPESLLEVLSPLVLDSTKLGDSSLLLGELQKMILTGPADFDRIIKSEQIREYFIEELSVNEIDQLIQAKLSSGQAHSFKQATFHLDRYTGYLSEQEMSKIRQLFSGRVLLQLSLGGMQAWSAKDWGRMVFHTINIVIGRSKHRSILFRIKEKLNFDHSAYKNGNLRFISQLNELVDASSEKVMTETKKVFKEMVREPGTSDRDTLEDPEGSLDNLIFRMDSQQRSMHQQAHRYLNNLQQLLSVSELKAIKLLISQILNSLLDRSSLRTWRAGDWGALLFHSMNEVLGTKKNRKLQFKIVQESGATDVHSNASGESVLAAVRSLATSTSEKEKEESRNLFDASLQQLQVREQLQKDKFIKQEAKQIEEKLHSSQLAYYEQAVSHINNYKPHISTEKYQSIRQLVSKFLLIKLKESDLGEWGMKEWGHLVYHGMNEVIGVDQNEEIRNRIQDQLNIETEIEINESQQLVNELASLASEIPKVVSQDEPHSEENKDYKKLGENIEREYLDPIFINNAGLIILAPFLGMLFERCGLMEDSRFKDEESKYRAVQLLSYAATGEAGMEEHDLVINKVLCGMDIMAPLNRIKVLSTFEMETVDGMLTAVTQQWSPLRETSIDSLRETFLRRSGKLEEEEVFYLKVEQQSYDMLLNRIPWNISKIKLSWMKKILEVEWKT